MTAGRDSGRFFREIYERRTPPPPIIMVEDAGLLQSGGGPCPAALRITREGITAERIELYRAVLPSLGENIPTSMPPNQIYYFVPTE